MSKTSANLNKSLDFNLSFIKRQLPSIVFILIALTVGLVFIKNIGTLVGPDMFSAHYKAALATATGQAFKDPIEIEYGKRHLIQGEEKYFLSGGQGCVGGAFVSTVVDDNPLASDGMSACVRAHDKSLSEGRVAETDAILQYPLLAYLPQGVALAIGMNLKLEPVYAQTLARFLNLAVYIGIILISIRLVDRGKWLIVLLALLPTSLFLSSSMSADGLNIAWSFLFVTYILKLYAQQEKASKAQIITLAVVGLGLFVLKIAYAPLLLLILALGGRSLTYRLSSALFFAIGIIGSIIYLLWSSSWGSLNAMVDISLNLQAILHNLPSFLVGLVVNVLHIPVLLLEMKEPMYLIFAVAIFSTIAYSLRGVKPASADHLFEFIALYRLQLLALCVALIIFAVTYTALLITWTNISVYGFMNIQGFQGRYVLPVLPLLLVFYYLPQRIRK